MFKSIVFLILTLNFFAYSHPHKNVIKHRADEGLIVTLSHGGKVRGRVQTIKLVKKLFSFQGIPYAQPPIGSLRFKNPKPHPGWYGVRDARKQGSICVGIDYVIAKSGSENCLFLNVYVPPNLRPQEKYAVMFWIHPGSFTSGSGNQVIFGPERLVNEGVIVITINYRLGVLGFLSTNDKFAQGNYGLKDCVEALRWVQNNIEVFGGDPNRVTIFGESAGASIVHYLILSRMASGLFHRAISQSGTAINPWAFQDNPKLQAFIAGRKMKLKFTTTEELVNKMLAVKDPLDFTAATPLLYRLKIPRGNLPFPFGPVVEPDDSEEERFLTDTPLSIMKNGNFNKVPYICGNTNEEALYVIREEDHTPDLLNLFNKYPSMLLPYEWHIEENSEAAYNILTQIQKMYFRGFKTIKDIMNYVKYATDRHFEYATYKTIDLMSQAQTEPIYYYIFSFSGTLNILKKTLFLSNYEGAMHADDLGYIWQMFGFPAFLPSWAKTDKTRTRMLRMWTDFAKYGIPTPKTDRVIYVNWTQVGTSHKYLNFGEVLKMEQEPFPRRMAMWKELDEKYSNAK